MSWLNKTMTELHSQVSDREWEAVGVLNEEWSTVYDNEAGPGWDWIVVIPGRENIMGLSEDVARRIVDDHNARLVPKVAK